uniref:Uncharacterized protein n=1 Tax=Strigamia maritima TaxID=126957 RepID=T1IX09_STRMM
MIIMNFLRRIMQTVFEDTSQVVASQMGTHVEQHGKRNACIFGNKISIHIDNFNSGEFQDNPYYHMEDIPSDVLKSLIPIFEAHIDRRL